MIFSGILYCKKIVGLQIYMPKFGLESEKNGICQKESAFLKNRAKEKIRKNFQF